MIDVMPDRSLPALKPLLVFFTEDYWKPVIEPASPEEIVIIEERMRDYEQDPTSNLKFTPYHGESA